MSSPIGCAVTVLVLLAYGVSVRGETGPDSTLDAIPPEWSHTCSLTLVGSSTGLPYRLHCWASASSGEPGSPQSSLAASVSVSLGGALAAAAADGNVDLTGVSVLEDGRASSAAALAADPPLEDWGITFWSVPHLRILDSMVSDLPLSTPAALLHFVGCSYVTFDNVTLERLAGFPVAEASDADYDYSYMPPPAAEVFSSPPAYGGPLGSPPPPAYGGPRSPPGEEGGATAPPEGADSASLPPPAAPSDEGASPPLVEQQQLLPLVTSGAIHVEGCLGVAFLNSRCSDVSDAYGWACLYIQTSSPQEAESSAQPTSLRITNSTFKGNQVSGAGVDALSACTTPDAYGGYGAVLLAAVRDADVSVTDSAFANNTGGCGSALAAVGGLGEAAVGTVALSFTRASVTDSSAAQAGAIYTNASLTRLQLSDSSRLDGNVARLRGGAVLVTSGDLTDLELTGGSSISQNAALRRGGGAFMVYSGAITGQVLLTGGSSLSYNNASTDAGALYVELSVRQITIANGSSVDGNSALGGSGGMAFIAGGVGSLVIANGSSVSGNQAANGDGGSYGGAVYIGGSIAALIIANSSSVAGNQADVAANGNGGAVYVEGSLTELTVANASRVESNVAGADGGGVYCFQALSALTVSNGSSLSRNTAGMAWANALGGAVTAADYGSVRVTANSSLSYNSANQGGALHARCRTITLNASTCPYGNGGIGVLAISGGSSMSHNRALSWGGAVMTWGNISYFLITDNSSVDNNVAADGGAVSARGNIDAWVVTNGSRVSSNSAKGYGGAANVEGFDQIASAAFPTPMLRVTVTNSSSVVNNSAQHDGVWSADANRMGIELVVANGSSVSSNRAHTLLGRSGVFSAHVASVTVVNGSTISNNSAGSAGVGYADELHALTVSYNSSLDNNTATTSLGGAFAVRYGGTVVLGPYGSVYGNSARSSGGFLLAQLLLVNFTVLDGSRVAGNQAGASGGVLHATAIDTVSIADSEVSGNAAEQFGGVFALGVGGVVRWRMSNSTLRENRAGTDGGVLHLGTWGAEDQASADYFATGRGIGAAYSDAARAAVLSSLNATRGSPSSQPTAQLEASGSVLSGNAAGRSGGAIALAACSLELSGGVFEANRAVENGGAIAATAAAASSTDGGSSPAVLLSIAGAVFANGSALSGGALHASRGVALQLDGSRVVGCSATTRGGGLSCESCERLLVTGTSIAGCAALGSGGGVSVSSCPNATIADSALYGNAAGRGGACFMAAWAGPGLGSAGPAASGLLTLLRNTSVVLNTAALLSDPPGAATGGANGTSWPSGYGGGLFVDGGPNNGTTVASVPSTVLLDSVAFAQNRAWLGADLATTQTCSASSTTAQPELALGSGLAEGPSAVPACSLLVQGGSAGPVPQLAGANATSSGLELVPALIVPIRQASAAWSSDWGLSSFRVACNDTLGTCPAAEQGLVSGVETPPAAAVLAAPAACGTLAACPRLEVKTGEALTLVLGLADHAGRAVSSLPDKSSYTITLRAEPTPDSAPTALPDTTWASLNGSASLSLSFQADGTAPALLLVLGWPGAYLLRVTVVGPLDIAPLAVPFVLRGCGVGEELAYSPTGVQESRFSSGRASSPILASCSPCPRRQVGLKPDPRTPLSASLTEDSVGAEATAASTVCLPCPANAVCPGGSIVVPLPGYWHSSPSSTLIHACPNEDACSGGAVAAGASGVTILAEMADVLPGINSTLQLLAAEDDRTLALTACQYAAGRSNITSCRLANVSFDDPTAYTQQLCANGYTGNLCAACEPGYTGSLDFECTECPAVARTVCLGLLAFLGSVFIITYGAMANFGEGTRQQQEEGPQDEGPAAGDVLKVLVVHIQYFIIIARLNIQKPKLMTAFIGLLAASTGAENYLTYNHACLLPDQDSAQQAYLALLGALLTPCAVVVACLILWALRFLLFNRARLKRSGNSRQGSRRGASRRPSLEVVRAALEKAPKDVDEQDPKMRSVHNPVFEHSETGEDKEEGAPGKERGDEPVATAAASIGAPEGSKESPGSEGPSPLLGPAQIASMAHHGGGKARDEVEASPVEDEPDLPTKPSLVGRAVESIHNWRLTLSDGLQHVDQTMSLLQQLGIVLVVAVFVLFPSWANAAFSVFSCYVIDHPRNVDDMPLTASAASAYGYWVRSMNQACYSGVHQELYVPLGIVFLLVFCITPPVANFALLWRVRHKFDDPHVISVYGFMYMRYKPKMFWWDSVLQVQTLAMVAVDVFGQGVDVEYQALMLLCVLVVISAINVTIEPLHAPLLRYLEFVSSAVLVLTIALSMFFVVGDSDVLEGAAGNAIVIIMLVINVVLVAGFLFAMLHFSPAKRLIDKASQSFTQWRSARFSRMRSAAAAGGSGAGPNGGGTRGIPGAESLREAGSGRLPPAPSTSRFSGVLTRGASHQAQAQAQMGPGPGPAGLLTSPRGAPLSVMPGSHRLALASDAQGLRSPIAPSGRVGSLIIVERDGSVRSMASLPGRNGSIVSPRAPALGSPGAGRPPSQSLPPTPTAALGGGTGTGGGAGGGGAGGGAGGTGGGAGEGGRGGTVVDPAQVLLQPPDRD
ncbi:hypothetical protein HYH03_003969 [Edaphochlamys debaryana]|uniref:Uncharacterized protein n=1 Tax=Edaphochlamys debaryana TaxID=47281 RepID=A0A835YBG4_9CHLO|nr:hypothetical protein HYH03_003969 [Edaphochlamys debaryana]|eukprot:KAG2498218.1 hypothetical protein HYH03_003969 [Edaphochlamys debaryana]